MIEVRWNIPSALTSNYSRTLISRAVSESAQYSVVHQLDTVQGGVTITSWIDPNGLRSNSYIVEWLDPITTQKYSDYELGYFPFTPREKRLMSWVTEWVPDMLKPDISDPVKSMALRLALNHFNIYPPETSFTMSSFPKNYEQYLLAGAQINLAMLKFLKVSIRDFSYSDMGFSVNIDRGAKMNQAIKDLNEIYNQTIERAKWNFISQGLGLGSVPLNVGVGNNLGRSLMNVLDMFNAMGR